ncbi:MAG: hypothetical protein OXJ62_09475 [Spirochaetaceae bacterium]|nr:hypothetical protein [Spirochaetaceae bacterium]
MPVRRAWVCRRATPAAWRTGLVLSLAFAASAHWPAAAQEAGAAPLEVPDLTVTAEDPLILLPPLGPPVNQEPLAVPGSDRRRAVHRAAPAVNAPGFGPLPEPGGVLRIARSVQAVERSSVFSAWAGAVGADTLDETLAALSYRDAGFVPNVELGLSGMAPTRDGGAADVSAQVALEANSWRVGLEGAATVAGDLGAGRGARAAWIALNGGAGPWSGTLSAQHWQARSAPAEWRPALATELELISAHGPRAVVGLAAGRTGERLFALPAVRVRSGGTPDWHLAAGVRPVLGFPRWLPHLVYDGQHSNRAIQPDEGWLAWLGGGIGAVDLRAGWAHGLSTGTRSVDGPASGSYAPPVLGPDLLLFGVAAEATWNTGSGGPVTVAARAGANWHRDAAHWRVRADGQWQITAAPPITLLVGARWIDVREYQAVYAGEDWTLAMFRDEPGSAVIAGLRWSPAWGHRLQLTAGINALAAASDLTWGVRFEYARDVVRLTAPP